MIVSESSEGITINRPVIALRRLRQLRSRRRLMRVVTGVLRWLALASVAMWAAFLLDWVAVLPQLLRGFQGAFWIVLPVVAFRAI
ncbi:MAG TPA: hypothetical protein DGU45_09165, partial [Planctomycetes bacterium]|nr:hypothetical protein [Planctomycetota bacterium]